MDMGQLSQLTAPDFGKVLKRVRQYTDYSQQEVADMLNVGFTTYQKWEQGKRKPRACYRRQIGEVFKEILLALDLIASENAVPGGDDQETITTTAVMLLGDPQTPLISEHAETNCIVASSEDVDAPDRFIARNMTMSLWNLTYANHLPCSEKPDAIRQAIKDFDAMNAENKSYQMTRREALSSLATLPMITLGLQSPASTVQPTQYGDALAHCTAALEGCWQLYRSGKSGNASDIQLAFQCVSKYLPVLDAVATDSAQYRSEALDLATRYALLKTLLGYNYAGTTEAVRYGKNALALSQATGDILLQLSAYNKLGWAYFADKQYTQAHKTMLEGESVLKNYQRTKNMQPLPSCVIGAFHSGYALVQANHGILPDTALGIAANSETGSEPRAFMQFTLSTQLLEAAWICSSKGDPAQAISWLARRIDPETLAPRPDVPQSQLGRIEAINIMTRSLLQSHQQDMERAISAWTAGIEGAKALKSEQRYREAITNFETMRILWPGETRIIELFPLTEHW